MVEFIPLGSNYYDVYSRTSHLGTLIRNTAGVWIFWPNQDSGFDFAELRQIADFMVGVI